MAFKPDISYLNLAHAERSIVDFLNDFSLGGIPLIVEEQWVEAWELVGVTSAARRDAFFQAWAMVRVPENPFNCFSPEGCIATNSPRLGQVQSLKLVGELSPCDPFGEFVNFPFYPVLVPPPC